MGGTESFRRKMSNPSDKIVPRSAIPIPQSPRVLLIKPGSMGDVIHALPVAAAIKAQWPDCHLTWLIDSRWAELLKRNPDVDAVREFPRQRFRGPVGWIRGAWWAFGLSHLQPDLVIDLQGLLRSALFGRLSGAKQVVGGSDAREGARGFYHHVAEVDPAAHAVDRYFQVLAGAGGTRPAQLAWPLPVGELPDYELPEKFVLLHPFARGKNKSLTPEQVVDLCRRLRPLPVVLAGRFAGELNDLPDNVTDLLELTTLLELIGVIREAGGVVSVDSGPAHLAAALDRPLVSIHRWSDPAWVGPYSDTAWVWFKGQLRPARSAEPFAEGSSEIDETALERIAQHVKAEFGVDRG